MLPLSKFGKVRLAVLMAHIIGVWGLIEYWNPQWLLLTLLCHVCFLWLGNELYIHRFLAHRSFLMPVWLQKVCALLSVFNLFGAPIGIAATHISHHKFSDCDGDPHPASDSIRSWLWIHPKLDTSHNHSMMKRLIKDKWLVMINEHYFLIYFSAIAVFAIIDVRIVIYGFMLHVIYAFFCDGLINVVCHKYGYRRFETADNSRNNLYVNALLFFSGAALHNTHHANQGAYKLSRAWYEIDLVGWMIEVIKTRKHAV